MRLSFLFASAILAAHGCDLTQDLGGGSGMFGTGGGSAASSGGMNAVGGGPANPTGGMVGVGGGPANPTGGMVGVGGGPANPTGGMGVGGGPATTTGGMGVGGGPATTTGGMGVGGGPASSCSDGVLDGTETDIDCGGPACAKCALAKKCAVDADCESNACVMGVCQ